MDAVVIDPDPQTIAERRRLGLDRFDEVWDGEYHMVPPPSREHQRMGSRLLVQLALAADELGLEATYEIGLLAPGSSGWEDYRVPDLAVYDPAVATERGIEGAPQLVVEIRSPGDEAFRKRPFYESIGTEELLVVDQGHRWVRRWLRLDGRLVETTPPAGDQLVLLRAVPVVLEPGGGRLRCWRLGFAPVEL